MKLLNIHNNKRDVFLFCRDDSGKQVIIKDNKFYPFYYEPQEDGKDIGYDGIKLKKVIVSEPSDIPKYRTPASYSSDILFTKNYLIHKIDKLDKTNIKYLFWDIECQAKEMPSYTDPKYPISCISIYNSADKKIQTFFLKDFKDEETMLCAFVSYIKQEKPDLLLAWNSEFDYAYTYFRYQKVFKKNKDLAKEISPIHDYRRYYKIDNLYYPAGISILDFLILFKKIYMREASYTLDYIGEKHTGKGKIFKNPDFTQLTEDIKLRNVGDVQIMVDLEVKYKILSYYDEIRILTKSLWEDLYFNSHIVENLLFEEAKIKKLILPNVQGKNFNVEESEDSFEGATRECVKTGALFDIGKVDLGSAYPNAIYNFCLDPSNINDKKEGILINNVYWKQNEEALLPSLIAKVLILKNNLKDDLGKCKSGSDEEKKAQVKYDAIKAVVNSCFGVMGNRGFRLYSNEVASTITFLVREVLMYVKDNIEKENCKIVYWDTDSLFLDKKENNIIRLNELVQQWAKDKYNKDKVTIEFDYEGYFTKLFLLTKCRYYGYLQKKKGLVSEIKGIEAKRSSSSVFEKEYQKALLEMILNKNPKEEIISWVNNEKDRLKTLSILDVSFPCKLNNKKYENVPIFVRAYNNTKKIIKDFNVEKGELFYYTFIDNPASDRSVLAFTEKNQDFLKNERIDWKEITRRNIDSKTENIFEAMGWNYSIDNQILLF